MEMSGWEYYGGWIKNRMAKVRDVVSRRYICGVEKKKRDEKKGKSYKKVEKISNA